MNIIDMIISFIKIVTLACYKFLKNLNTPNSKKYSTLTIYEKYNISTFLKYIKKYIISDKNINLRNDYNKMDADVLLSKKTHFKDSSLNIEGYYTKLPMHNSSFFTNDFSTEAQYSINICILKTSENSSDIYKLIQSSLLSDNFTSTNIIYQVFLHDNTPTEKYPRYNLFKKITPTKCILYDEKDSLWSLIKHRFSNTNNISELGLHLLLHGPPGSGKSNFIYHMATYLNRYSCSITLTKNTMLDFINLSECFIMSIYDFDKTIQEIVNNEDNDHKYILSREDCMTLFKTPINTSKQKISISITDNLNEIKSIFPELLRPNRFMPVHFGYASIATIQEISKFYFNNKIKKHLPDTTTIATSDIISLALQYSILQTDDKFSKFESEILKLLNK